MAAGNVGCEAICKALKTAGSSGLKEVDFSNVSLDDKAASALAALLSSSRVLERLMLTHTNITDAGAQLICNALQVSQKWGRVLLPWKWWTSSTPWLHSTRWLLHSLAGLVCTCCHL